MPTLICRLTDGRIKQTVWHIKIAKPSGSAAGSSKGCVALDKGKNVTVEFEISEENENPSGVSYFNRFNKVGLYGMRTWNMQTSDKDPCYVAKGDYKLRERKYLHKALAYMMKIVALNPNVDTKKGEKGKYVANTLKASGGKYSFEIKPGTFVEPGQTLTSGEFLLFSEQPADTSYSNADGKIVYLPAGKSPHYVVRVHPTKITGYAKGAENPTTKTFTDKVKIDLENTIEGGGGYHAHIWLEDTNGKNLSGSGYYSTSGIGTYQQDFVIKHYEYETYSKAQVDKDGFGIEHARKVWILWDNRYLDINVVNNKIQNLNFMGVCETWEEGFSEDKQQSYLAQGKKLNHTQMVFLTKYDGSAWKDDNEMYQVNLLPGKGTPDLKFFSTYAAANAYGPVCGVVIENFDYKLTPETRNYLGIAFGMKFRNNKKAIGKSMGFTHTTINFHHYKDSENKPNLTTEVNGKKYLVNARRTVETIGSVNGESTWHFTDEIGDYGPNLGLGKTWANYAWNTGDVGTQIFYVNGDTNRDLNNSVKKSIVEKEIVPARKYRPTQWNDDGTMKGLTGNSHPHQGTSLYVLGDENKVVVKAIKDKSMKDILALDEAGQIAALANTKRAATVTRPLSAAGRMTFTIDPGWAQAKSASDDLESYIFVPTAHLTNGKKVVESEAIYASGNDANKDGGNATSAPVKITPGSSNVYDIKTFLGGNVPGKFTVIHNADAIAKFVEGDKYYGDPFCGRTVFISNGSKVIQSDSKGKSISLATKNEDNEYQQWKIVRHSTGGYAFVNVGSNAELDNGKVGAAGDYHSPALIGCHTYKSNEDDLYGSFNLSGSLAAATIKSAVGNYVMTTSGSNIVLQSGASTTWKLERLEDVETTGFIIHFTKLTAGQKLPLFHVDYTLDKEKRGPTKKVRQNVYIVENSPSIDTTVGNHKSTATVQFVDMRSGVAKETVNTNIIEAKKLNKGSTINFTCQFNNIYDDQRYLKMKVLVPKANDKNGSDFPASATVKVDPANITITSSEGDVKNRLSFEYKEAENAIYATGILEPYEIVKMSYKVSIKNLPESPSADGKKGYYVRNSYEMILDKVVNAKGNGTVAAVDVNGTSMAGEGGLRVASNRVETYITKDEPTDTPTPTITITTGTITTPPTTPVISPGAVSKTVNRVSNNVGEEHTWTIQAKVPERSDYPEAYDEEWRTRSDGNGGTTTYLYDRWRIDADLRSMVITDTIDSRLDYCGKLKVMYGGSDITSILRHGANSIRQPSDYYAGGRLEISIGDFELLQNMAAGGGYVTITYNTRINKTTEPEDHVENQAHYTYTVEKHVPRHTSTTSSGSADSGKPFVYTGETKVKKVNALNDDVLEGAIISIYTADGHIVRRNGQYPVNYGDAGYESLTEDYLKLTDEEGIATFYGLKDGTYYFREVVPPIGFEWNKSNSGTTVIRGGDGYIGNLVEIPNNPYQATTIEKSVEKNEWLTHEIHTWTVTGHIPQYFTDEDYAECQYQFIDEIDYQELAVEKKRLDYIGNVKVFVAGSQMQSGSDYKVETVSAYDGEIGRQRVTKLTVTMLKPGITAISNAAKGDGWKTNTVVLQYDTAINERAREHEIIPNRAELNYCGFGVRRFAKSDLRIIPSENPLDVWTWETREDPGYPQEFGEPGGHLVKMNPDVAEEEDQWLIDDPYVYTPYRELRINCIIDQKYDPYEDISFTYDIDGYPCYDPTKKLHWTVIINPKMDGDMIEASVFDSCQTELYRSLAKYGKDVLIYLPPGTYTVHQRQPMRYDLVEWKPEVTNAHKTATTNGIENDLISYRDAEDTFVNVLNQWNMHSSAFLQKNEPGLRPKLRGYLNIVLINGQKGVSVVSQDTGEEVYSGTRANVHCVKIDYGTYEIYVDGDFVERVKLNQYSMQRRYAIADD